MFKAKKETTILCGLALLVASFMGCGDSASANDTGEAEQGETITSSAGEEPVVSSQNVFSSSSTENSVPGLSSNIQPSSSSVNQNEQKSSQSTQSSSSKKVESSSSVSPGKQTSSQSTRSSSSKKVESSSAKRPSDFNGLTREDFLNDEVEYFEFEDERDHQKYKYVKIGSLYWMSQSLNYSDSVNTKSLTEGRSFCYNDNPSNCDVAGRLYTWGAAIDSIKVVADSGGWRLCGLYAKKCALQDNSIIQGICPEGWRLPNVSDWSGLISTVKKDKVKDKALSVAEWLRAKVGWDVDEYSVNGSDTYGFSAIPGGDRDNNYGGDGYDGLHDIVSFWSASPDRGDVSDAGGILSARTYGLRGNCNANSECTTIGRRRITNGHYVRCVKDSE